MTEIGAELAVIQAAQHALATRDPSGALTLLEDHARRFPQGALVEERAAARILALCDMHREADARVEGAAFLRDHPQSPQVPSVQRSCASNEIEKSEPR